jgi:hypothetical protein
MVLTARSELLGTVVPLSSGDCLNLLGTRPRFSPIQPYGPGFHLPTVWEPYLIQDAGDMVAYRLRCNPSRSAIAALFCPAATKASTLTLCQIRNGSDAGHPLKCSMTRRAAV